MRFLVTSLALLSTVASAATPAELRDAALADDHVAWDLTEGLTTEVGQRLAGTDAEARARTWAVAHLKALGFANVHVEPFDIPVWVRGEERAEVVGPAPQALQLAALGNSGATPPEGITADVVGFDGIDALRAARPEQVRGKIVFVTHAMERTQDGSSYGVFGAVRRVAPSIASLKGAAAIVIRSIGTDHHRVPHTGVQSWSDGARPIPAAALSVPDAEQLSRLLSRGRVQLRLVLTPRFTGTHPSGNVIAEVPGRDAKAGIVLIGGHLDSWDLGTGAIDDAAGVAITAAAAKRVMAAGRPLHTIRVVWFGDEEFGGLGAAAYAKAHGSERHVMAGESDFGADRVWRFDTRVADGSAPLVRQIGAALLPLGITQGHNDAEGGTDVGPMIALGTPAISLRQDGLRYFDLHHTADDTLDKIDPVQLRQNVAAWTALLAVVGNSAEALQPAPR